MIKISFTDETYIRKTRFGLLIRIKTSFCFISNFEKPFTDRVYFLFSFVYNNIEKYSFRY